MRKLLVSLCLLLLALTGCTSAPSPTPQAQHIVSLNLDADEILLDLVPPERIAALSNLVDIPEISYSTVAARQVSGRVQAYTLEEILSLHPDLIICSDWLDESLERTLREMGITVYRYPTAKRLDEIPAVIRGIAAATGTGDRGEAVVARYEERLAALTARAAAVPAAAKPRVFLWAYNAPFGGGDTLFGDMCRRLGVPNVLEPFPEGDVRSLPQEFLLQADPDCILLTAWHMEEDEAALRAVFTDNPAYAGLHAVRNDDFRYIPGRVVYCPSQYAVDGLAELAAILLPEESVATQ
ncbi:MAG: ABC transporter substrate-binding protein [Veillonellaceae bacterium]|nr:ABC transporter substrate-binding protein [Veillonellaceae bacterium]